MQTAAVLRTV